MSSFAAKAAALPPDATRPADDATAALVAALRTEIAGLKARLAEAEAAADLDPLTPVSNRRAFARALRRIAAYSGRYGAPASLVYFDLDDLKAINDRHGHAVGDAALHAVAERLSRNVRESDVVGRMGGDEFAVVLAHADLRVAEAKAAALAALIERTPVQYGDVTLRLSVSYGLRQIDPSADPETLIAEADAQMFARKRTRKTRAAG